MTHTTVTCECGAKVIPRLWHRYGNLLSYTRTHHLCPICGVVMYETGGGFRAFVPIGASLVFFMLAMGYINAGHWLTGGLSVMVSTIILFFSFPAFSGRMVRHLLARFRRKAHPSSISLERF